VRAAKREGCCQEGLEAEEESRAKGNGILQWQMSPRLNASSLI